MKKNLLFLLLGNILVFSGCLKNQNEQDKNQEKVDGSKYLSYQRMALKTASGYPRLDTTIYAVKDTFYKSSNLYFYYIRLDTGTSTVIERPSSHDWVFVNITASLMNLTGATLNPGTIIETNNHTTAANVTDVELLPSNALISPLYVHIDSLSIVGLIEGLPKMKSGSTYRFIIPSDLAFDGYGASQSYTNAAFSAYSTLVYDVQLVKIVKDPKIFDSTNLHNWVDTLKLDMLSSDTGKVYYKVTSPGTSTILKDGDEVKVVFKGKLIDENIYFTDSTKYDSTTVTLGSSQLIYGWELALRNLYDSCKAELVIPWDVGYKYGLANGYGQIVVPRYHSLYFELNKVVRTSSK